MLRQILTVVLLTILPAIATAQSVDTPISQPQRSPIERSVSDWPDPHDGRTYSHNMDIVTLSSPTVRQHCSLRELTTDTITCESVHHRPPKVFQRDDILALIAPPAHDNLFCFLEVGALVAAALVPSFFVPLAGAITLRIIGGFLFFGGWGACGVGADHILPDHNHDILLYQRPGTTLTLHLH